jgi:hypothetical protein
VAFYPLETCTVTVRRGLTQRAPTNANATQGNATQRNACCMHARADADAKRNRTGFGVVRVVTESITRPWKIAQQLLAWKGGE